MPAMPPMMDCRTTSPRSCFCTSLLVQPIAFRMPISRERSTKFPIMVLIIRKKDPAKTTKDTTKENWLEICDMPPISSRKESELVTVMPGGVSKAYFNRSIVYINLGNYDRATTDVDRAMLLKPAATYT